MFSLKSFIIIACLGAGFASSYRAFTLIEIEPVFAALYFGVAACWVYISARKMTSKKRPPGQSN